MFKLLNLINGYKTYSASIIMALTGAIEMISAFNGDGDFVNGVTLISGALMGTGLKHSSVKGGL